MAARSATVILDANIGPYTAKMTKAAAVGSATGKSIDSSMTRAIAGTQKLAQSTGMLPGKFGAMATAGGAAFAGVGLALAFTAKKFADFEVAMDAVGAATGASQKELDQLGATALEAAADTKFGASEAARGMEALAKAGIETADIIGGGLKGALDLAAAGEIEVAEAAELAASAMTQFKMEGDDVPHIADLIAAGAGKAQGSVADMGAALGQTGLVASQMGLDLEETTAGLAAFASAGLIGSDAGTSMRTMLLRLANPTDVARSRMEALGIAAYDAQGNFVGLEGLAGQLRDGLSGLTQEQRNASLAIIFGQDAIRGANVLYENGARGIKEWGGKVDDAGFAAEQAAERTDNLQGDLERLGGTLEQVAIENGGEMNSFLREFVQGLDTLIEKAGQVNRIDWLDIPQPEGPDVPLSWDVLLGAGPVQSLDEQAASSRRAGEAVAFHAENLSAYKNVVNDSVTATEAATAATEANAVATEEQLSAWGEAAGDFISFQDAYTTALDEKETAERESAEATAASTKSSEDSWKDFVGEVDLTVDEYLAVLEEQIAAQAEWEDNLITIAGRVPDAMFDELVKAGPKGAEAIALMAKMTNDELAVAVEAWEAASGQGAAAIADRLAEAAPVLADIAAELGQTVADKIAQGMKDNGTTVYEEAQRQGLIIDEGVGIRRPRVVPISPRVAERDMASANAKIATLLTKRYVDIHFQFREPTGGLGGFGAGGTGFTGGFPLPAGTYHRTQGPHDGGAIDYGAPRGTPIRATFSGALLNRDLGNRSYGKYYTLTGGGKYELGAHLMGFARPSGPVQAGSLIGWVDSTGNSTGNHLHLLRNFHTGGWTPGGPINSLKGEYVVHAQAANNNKGLLEAINAGRGGSVSLTPDSVKRIGRTIAGEIIAAVGAGAYSVGKRAELQGRAG